MKPHPHFTRLIKRATQAPQKAPSFGSTWAPTIAKVMAPAARPPAPTPIQQARTNTAQATGAAQSSWAPGIARAVEGITNSTQFVNQGVDRVTSTPDNFYRDWLGPVAGWVPDQLANAGKTTIGWGRDGLQRMGNAGNAAAEGNFGAASAEAGQGLARLGGAALSVIPGAGGAVSKALPWTARMAQHAVQALPRVSAEVGTAMAQDDKGGNQAAPVAPAPAPVAQTQDPESQINFQAMLPFLMAIMPQLFGGASGQGGQFTPETSLDRLARRNPYV